MMKSLSLGNKGEDFAIKIFTNANIEAEKNEDVSKREYYDLVCKIGKKKFTAEVKYDWMAQKTGNIAIEFYNSKSQKNSGIAVTKANLWIHMLEDGSNLTMWAASVKELKKFIKDNPAHKQVFDVGDNNACLHLYKEKILLNNLLHRCETLDEKALKKLIRKLLK